jgi:hypothetical protein
MAIPMRHTLLVDHAVQWAIVWHSLRHWLYHCLVAVALLAGLQFLLGGVFKPWSEHWQAIWPMAASVTLSLVILLPRYLYDSLKLSNRFAGPVYRMRRVLREVAAGKPFTPVTFRAGDFWAEMAEELNAAVETLTRRAAEERASPGRAADRPLEDLETSVN